MKIKVEMTRDDIDVSLSGYPVVVEMWRKVQESMTKRRKYNESFTKEERVKISRFYKLFYDWYLKKGVPDTYSLYPENLVLMQRAIQFFGTI